MNKPIKKFLYFKYPDVGVALGYACIVAGIAGCFYGYYIISGLSLLCGAYLAFSYVGIDINLGTKKFRHYTSHFGSRKGHWRSLHLYPYISILTIGKKSNVYGPTQVEILDKFKVYRVVFLNEHHTRKLLLGEYASHAAAKRRAGKFARDLGAEIVLYSPDFSK